MTIFATDVMSYISNVIGSLMPGIGVALLLGTFLETCYLARRNCNYFDWNYFRNLLFTNYSIQYVGGERFGGPALPVTLLTFVTGVVVSYLTPNPVHSEQERVQLVMLSREAEEQKMNLKPLKA